MTAEILVVDDHAATLDLVTTILSKRGYHVHRASSGPGGLASAIENIPDLILLDVNMPGMDGFAVLEQLREKETTSHIPVIMFTAKSQAADKLTGFGKGADDYLVKPTSPHELLQRVKIQLNRVGDRKSSRTLDSTVVDASEPKQTSVTQLAPTRPDSGKLASNSAGQAQITCVLGTRGGVGTTTVALNLAYAMSKMGQRTILTDFDLEQGHIAVYLQRTVGEGVHELAMLTKQQLTQKVHDIVVSSQGNLSLLLSENNIANQLPKPSPDKLLMVLETLRQECQQLVIDAGRGMNTVAHACADEADRIVLCVRAERVALTAARQLVHFVQFAQPDKIIHPVLLMPNAPVSVAAIEKYLGRKILSVIPPDDTNTSQAYSRGMIPIQASPDSEVANTYLTMCRQLVQA
jgi:DNA-binding response OmpR family regulator/MinD-like ATPase involved in chromosome partitioning or flagellar assembly